MVGHVPFEPEVGVFIGERVEAMRARGDDLLLGDVVLLERLHVLFGEQRKEILVARTPGGIPRARFFVAQDRKVDARKLQQLREGTRGFLRTVIVDAAQPTQ